MAVVITFHAWPNFAEVTVEPTSSSRWAQTVANYCRSYVSIHGFFVSRVKASPILMLQAITVTVMDAIAPARAVTGAPTVSIVVITPTPFHATAVPSFLSRIG